MRLLPILTLLLLAACGPARNNGAEETTPQTQTTASVGSDGELAGEISIEDLDARYPGAEKAYLAGGCFWCTEAALDRIKGVRDVWSGYAGGRQQNPTYKQVSYGNTDHAEAIVVYYDPAEVSYETLLDVFFVAHDPTQVDRQGPDVGAHYRSAIFPLNDAQRTAAEAKIAELNASGKFDRPIATKIEDIATFWVAEAYHQDYYEDPTNPNQSYVQNVTRPKVEKVVKQFADILKEDYRP